MCIFISIVCLLLFLIMVGISIPLVLRYFKLKDLATELDNQLVILQKNNQERSVEYSDQMVEFVRKIVMQIAVLQFRAFCDKHQNLAKITESNVKELAESVANMARDSFNTSNIPFENVYFTQTFFDKYIIETAIMATKDLTDKVINELDEDMFIDTD